jgi:hypothetical protein
LKAYATETLVARFIYFLTENPDEIELNPIIDNLLQNPNAPMPPIEHTEDCLQNDLTEIEEDSVPINFNEKVFEDNPQDRMETVELNAIASNTDI